MENLNIPKLVNVKLVVLSSLALVGSVTLYSNVQRISTEPGYETVLVDKPFFSMFSKGGVQPDTQKPGSGWYWKTTNPINFKTTTFRLDENFDKLSTSNNNFVNYNSYLNLRITNSPELLQKFGVDWYQNNLQEQYRTIVRNSVRNYTFESLLTNPDTTDAIEKQVKTAMVKLIDELKIPVKIADVSLGKATPNKSVQDEMDETARQQQRVKTMKEKSLADISEQNGRIQSEKSRKEAEELRAVADNAYLKKMGLTPEQFVQLQYIKQMSEACSNEKSNCIIGNVPGLTIGR